MMKISDIRGKTLDELQQLLLTLKKEAFNLRFQKANGEIEKVSRVRHVRKDIAKVSTIITEVIRKQQQGEASNA